MMSALKDAFSKAGYQPLAGRLHEIAVKVCRTTTAWNAQRDMLLKEVKGDAGLLWALFEPFQGQAAQLILSKANQEIRVERQKQVVATARQETPGAGFDRPNPSGGGHKPAEHQALAAPARPTAARDPKNRFLGAETVRASLLDSVLINGRKMGDVPVWEARKWAEKFGTEARFVQLLAANLPPNATIREYRSEDDVKAIWESVQKEVAEGKYA